MKDMGVLELLGFFFIFLLVLTYSRRAITLQGIQVMSIFLLSALFIFCISLWRKYVFNHEIEFFSFHLNVVNANNISYEISLKVSSLSFLFALLVIVIGLATNIYILNYFKMEERGEEFVLLINWFIFSMIFLVFGNNFFTLILGWELIGLTSFLLINFWRFKVGTLSCSFKAFVFNKVSDVFLMISFAILWNAYKANDLDVLFLMIKQHPGKNINSLFYSGLFMIISCGIKSAQICGHLWLPDSMEAPIPASSLIHSATLVSAGIYLVLKFHLIFYYANLYNFIFFIGAITGFYGGVVASAQTDIKKLLAYSTISHCGFIFSSLALDNFIVTIVYLYLHGLFKALTFFCAGSLVKFNNTQDMRQMGMLRSQFMNTTMLIGASINLAGLPYTIGYLYKSLFLQILIVSPYNIISYGFLISGMLSSIVYVYKIIYYSCFDYRKGDQDILTLYLQNNTSVSKYFVLFFNFSKYLAFILLYLFSVLFFIVVKYFVLKNYLFIYNGETVYVNNLMFLTKHTNLQRHLVSLYYTLFFMTILVLLLVGWRSSFFAFERFSLVFSLLAFIYFLILFSAISAYLSSYFF